MDPNGPNMFNLLGTHTRSRYYHRLEKVTLDGGDDFNVKNAVYKTPQKIDTYIDPSLTAAAVK